MTAALIVVLAGALFACTNHGDYTWEGFIFPRRARVGDTVSMVIGGNTAFADIQAWVDEGVLPNGISMEGLIEDDGPHNHFGLTRDNVRFDIYCSGDPEGSPTVDELVPSAVFPLRLDPASVFSHTRPDGSLTVAVFEVPSSLDPCNGETVEVRFTENENFYADLFITGDSSAGGTPATPAFPGFAEMERRPTLRLRVRPDESLLPVWDGSWTIGGLEFTLTYTGLGVENPQVIPRGEAGSGLGMVQELMEAARVMVVDPVGFKLNMTGYDDGRRGLGVAILVDVAFDPSTVGFTEADFAIDDLVVYGTDGSKLLDRSAVVGEDDTAYFKLYPLPTPSI